MTRMIGVCAISLGERESVVVNRRNDETYNDYFVRLFEHKDEYGLTCAAIADLLNQQNGQNKGECAYRKEYRAFKRGREYERSLQERGVSTKILAISDLHVPYELPIETFADYRGVDVLVINGDIEDCQSISKFLKSYRVPLAEEMVRTRTYLINLITYINPGKVVITRGNHEDRLLTYMSNKLDPDVVVLMPDSPVDLIVRTGFRFVDRKNHIETFYEPLCEVMDVPVEYDGNWWCQIGRTIFAHPKTFSSSMLKTTEKAQDYFLRCGLNFDSIVLAHTHKLGQYVQGHINLYEQGCCCRTEELNYSDGMLSNPQQKGFILVCQDENGNIMPANTKLIQL